MIEALELERNNEILQDYNGTVKEQLDYIAKYYADIRNRLNETETDIDPSTNLIKSNFTLRKKSNLCNIDNYYYEYKND
jgi:hypothetical protein